MKVDFAREIALKILYEIETKKAYSNLLLDEYINRYREKLSVKDINLISEIVYGVVTWRLTLDTVIGKYASIKINKIAKWILEILRMGAYQILFLDKIPKSAAVNESVNLAKKYGFPSANFVNAILRKIEKQDYEQLKQIADPADRLSKVYAMPKWLIDCLLKEQTIQDVEEICKASNARPATVVRMNTLKISKEAFIQKLQEASICFEQMDIPSFFELKQIKNIGNQELFKQGYFTVQDKGAGEIVKILDPKPNEKILDACSAPGGKTTQIAEQMQNTGEIIAWDLYDHRINLVLENAKRLGITTIHTQVKDASSWDKQYLDAFDKILLDVPCLGIGVMKRKPDIKWQRRQEDIEQIGDIQLQLLEVCSSYLKVGGKLVYSTCSILKEENEEIVAKWQKEDNVESKEKTKKFKVISQKNRLPSTQQDGFFICEIVREQ